MIRETKSKVHQDSGKLGVEFTDDKIIPNFNKGDKKVHLGWTHSFTEFKNCLLGQYKTAWADQAMVPAMQNRLRKENFCCAIKLSLQKTLHEKKPRDCQYIYMAPGSDFNVQK